jgi:hypothetical protein
VQEISDSGYTAQGLIIKTGLYFLLIFPVYGLCIRREAAEGRPDYQELKFQETITKHKENFLISLLKELFSYITRPEANRFTAVTIDSASIIQCPDYCRQNAQLIHFVFPR